MKKILFVILASTVAFFMYSCASSPKKGEKTAKQGATPETSAQTLQENGNSLDELQRETEALMNKVREIKGDVAMKEEFAKALGVYEKALSSKQEGSKRKAADLFREAKDLFQTVCTQTEEKRARAERAIEESNRELQIVEQKAKGAGLK
jgi:hypothetical protein